jgi:uncharacterized protein YbjT (DUF2867 family)
MDVVVVGGHGRIALRLLRILATRGDRARGVVRDPAQTGDLEAAGAEAVVCDIESAQLNAAVAGADAVVFAAGAGAGGGPERKRTVDYGGAVKLIEAATAQGVGRYVMVSSIGAHDPAAGPEAMRPYLEAKAEADAALVASGLAYTIVRPGSLSDEPGTGLVEVGTELGRRGPVRRDDVAAVLAEVLIAPNTIGRTFELFEGEVPVADAVRSL